jgi:hypothetical protein
MPQHRSSERNRRDNARRPEYREIVTSLSCTFSISKQHLVWTLAEEETRVAENALWSDKEPCMSKKAIYPTKTSYSLSLLSFDKSFSTK